MHRDADLLNGQSNAPRDAEHHCYLECADAINNPEIACNNAIKEEFAMALHPSLQEIHPCHLVNPR